MADGGSIGWVGGGGGERVEPWGWGVNKGGGGVNL